MPIWRCSVSTFRHLQTIPCALAVRSAGIAQLPGRRFSCRGKRQPEWAERDGLKEMTAMNGISSATSEHNLHCISTWVCSWGCLLWFVLARFGFFVWIFPAFSFYTVLFGERKVSLVTGYGICRVKGFLRVTRAETLVSYNLYMSSLLSCDCALA